MLKALRKYNKWVMVVFGSVLMVSFLFTGASSQFQPDPRKQVVATIGDEKLRRMDYDQAERELAAVGSLAPSVVRLTYGVEDGTHWLLLTREAQRLGLVGDERDGLDWLSSLSQREAYTSMVAQYARQFGSVQWAEQLVRSQPQAVDARARELQVMMESMKGTVAAKHGMTDRDFAVALSRFRAIDRLMNLYGSLARQSDRRYVAAARRFSDAAIVDAAIIAAETLTETAPAPTEEALLAHFEKYRSVEPGTGDHGFGYVLEPRVKLEWLLLSRSAVEGAVTLDPIAVNKHWQLNRTKYPGEFSIEQVNVERDLRNSKVASIMDEADRVFKSRVRAQTGRLPVDGIYRRLPATWDIDAPKLGELATAMSDAIRTSSGVTVPPPMISRPLSEWTALSELENLGGIGGAAIRMANGTMPFAQLVSLTREISPQVTIDLQARVPFTTFTPEDAAGNRYYFLVTDVKPEAPAENLDVVREQVVKDVKTLAAYEKLVAEKDVWTAKAVSEGLAVMAGSFQKPGRAEGAEPQPLEVIREVSVTADIARNADLNEPAVRDRIMSVAEKLGPMFVATPENAGERTFAEPLPKLLSLAVIQIGRKSLVAKEDLLSQPVGRALQFVAFEQSELRDELGVSSPFSSEAVKSRLGYTLKGEDRAETTKGGEKPKS